jgi:leucine dehydrogenase
MAREGFEELVALSDRESGLRAFLGLHDTRPGPAFGGIRRWSYVDERQALRDCLRLARAMTRKCALLDLPAGGGKVVVLDDPALDARRAYEHLGRVVERLGGRFYTGPDVGTGPEALEWVASQTRYCTHPGPSGPGELAESTARGVLEGIAAALRALDGETDWERRTVVVQGLGDVGGRLVRSLVERGARVLATDIDADRAQALAAELDFELLAPSTEFDPPCDVFAPCALGGILHDLTVQRLHCRAIAGAANNQLARLDQAERLRERGVLYVPDFVINSGALIRGATFHMQGERIPVEAIGRRIGAVTDRLLARALAEERSTADVAIEEADRRIAARRSSAPLQPAGNPHTS